jgi:hypothetical protein
MDRRNRNAFLIAFVAISIGAFFLVRTFINSGPAAIAQMDSAELALLAKVERLQRGMSRTEVEAVLGEPDEYGFLGLRPMWHVNNNPLNGIAVYFHLNGADRVMWISLGRFSYEKNL